MGRTGVFITLSIALERMRYEGVVDMFQTVKTLRTQRPAMVQTEVCRPGCGTQGSVSPQHPSSPQLRLQPAHVHLFMLQPAVWPNLSCLTCRGEESELCSVSSPVPRSGVILPSGAGLDRAVP